MLTQTTSIQMPFHQIEDTWNLWAPKQLTDLAHENGNDICSNPQLQLEWIFNLYSHRHLALLWPGLVPWVACLLWPMHLMSTSCLIFLY